MTQSQGVRDKDVIDSPRSIGWMANYISFGMYPWDSPLRWNFNSGG